MSDIIKIHSCYGRVTRYAKWYRTQKICKCNKDSVFAMTYLISHQQIPSYLRSVCEISILMLLKLGVSSHNFCKDQVQAVPYDYWGVRSSAVDDCFVYFSYSATDAERLGWAEVNKHFFGAPRALNENLSLI